MEREKGIDTRDLQVPLKTIITPLGCRDPTVHRFLAESHRELLRGERVPGSEPSPVPESQRDPDYAVAAAAGVPPTPRPATPLEERGTSTMR